MRNLSRRLRRPRPGRLATHRPGVSPTCALRPSERVVWRDTDVAFQLSLPLAEARALLRNGSIPARQVGGVWTTTPRRVFAWLNTLPPPWPDDDADDDAGRDGEQDA